MNKYNEYTSVCNKCYKKGFHTSPEKCVRINFIGCETCGSHENISKAHKCTGTNVMIDYSEIAQKFAYYYGKSTRIKVAFKDKDGKTYETKSGTVAMTSGWKPSLMLMLRSNSTGSSYLLSDDDEIVAVL